MISSVPGKDKLFGHGELTFENYKIDPDFYMIEPLKAELQEEKYHLNLSFYAGGSVKAVEIKIDGITNRQVPVFSPGEKKVSLDIRDIDIGPHLLEVRPVFIDGTFGEVYSREFTVPEYNVRIRVYDAANQLIPNSRINVLGFSQKDRKVTKLHINPTVVNGCG